MTDKEIEEFWRERENLNRLVLDMANTDIRRFFALDTQVYRGGSLPGKTKEMLGLVASLVLRCDDCVDYHLVRCAESGVSTEELREVLSIGLVVGGSITIPHLRRAVKHWNELMKDWIKIYRGERMNDR